MDTDFVSKMLTESKLESVSDKGAEMFVPYDHTMGAEAFVEHLYALKQDIKAKMVGEQVIITNNKHHIENYENVDPCPGYLAKIRDVAIKTVKNPYKPENCEDRYFYHGIPLGYSIYFILTVYSVRNHSKPITKWYKCYYDDFYTMPENSVLLPTNGTLRNKYLKLAKANDIKYDMKVFEKKRNRVMVLHDEADAVHLKLVFG